MLNLLKLQLVHLTLLQNVILVRFRPIFRNKEKLQATGIVTKLSRTVCVNRLLEGRANNYEYVGAGSLVQ
jgi:hypothetical protein